MSFKVRIGIRCHLRSSVPALNVPIGRNSKELVREAGKSSRKIMKEEDLVASIMPNPVDIARDGKVTAQLWKPATW